MDFCSKLVYNCKQKIFIGYRLENGREWGIGMKENRNDTMAKAAPVDWNRTACEAVTDEQAFAALYEHFFPRVYQHLLAKTKDSSLADEIVSQAFFKMYDHLRDYDPEKGAFSTWLFRIAQNELTTYYRSRNYKDREELTEDIQLTAPAGEMPEEQVLTGERNSELKAALSTLSERDRHIIEMYYWLDMKSEDIAKELDMRPNTVRVALKRARDTLKKFLS